MKRKTVLLIALFLILVACSPTGGEPAASENPPTNIPNTPASDNPPTDTPDLDESVSSDDPTATPQPDKSVESEDVILSEATVESIDILILESFPVQVLVNVIGLLSDGCSTLADITSKQEGDTFFVTITEQRPADAVCTQQLVPFEENVGLDVNGLSAGTYTVNVNGVTDTFILDIDNTAILPDTDGEDVSSDEGVSSNIEASQEDVSSGVVLPHEDVAELLRLTLERALIAQEIPDYELLTADRDVIILSTENIDSALVPELSSINLMLLSPEEIQIKANAEGDFLYLRFDEFTAVSPTEARVALDNIWVHAEDSEMVYLSGGGFVIEYEKTADGWQGNISSIWIS